MVEYLRQMSAIVSESSDSEQASQALHAIITEIKGKEALIASDQKLSKVLEKLIESNGSTLEVVKALFGQLSPYASELVYDQYGSHVIETLLKATTKVGQDKELGELISSFTDFLCGDIFSLIHDRRATFVVRTAMVVFGGLSLGEGDMLEQIRKCESTKACHPVELKRVLDAVRTLDMDSLDSLSEAPHSSVTLQAILLVGSKTEPVETSKAITLILQDSQRCAQYLDNSIKAKLLETVAGIFLSPDVCLRILNELIDPRDVLCSVDGDEVVADSSSGLRNFMSHKFSFGFLQAFTTGISDVVVAAQFVNRVLSPEAITFMLSKGKAHGIGVLQKTAEMLVRVVPPQTTFFNNMCQALGATKDNVWMSILSMSQGGQEIDESLITPQGCLMMSTLFQFKVSSVQPIVSQAKAFLDHMAQVKETRFLSDVGPGRMLQTLMSPESCFPSNMKMKVIKQVLLPENAVERLTALVNDRRVGSWLVTTAWDSADVQTKTALGDYLLQIEGLRESNWKIWRHCALSTFSRRNDEWTQVENRKSKAKDFLKDIVGDSFKKSRNW